MSEEKRERPIQPPTIVLLVRHAMNDWVKTGKLAGRTPEVHLNERGEEQASRLAERLAGYPIRAIYASPQERAQETATALAGRLGLPVETSARIGEVDFGEWTGQKLEELAKTPEWKLVQGRPTAMRFPSGESIWEMQHRIVDEIERLAAAHSHEMIVLVSHADVIKAALAHYLGLHLDLFQRLIVSTASLSTLVFGPMGGLVVSLNDTAHLPPPHEMQETDG
jgi:probable phosphomutase (TIGR03848 family)